MKKLLFITLTLLTVFHVKGSHIVGGEIFYDYLGNNNYQITLKLYRDCNCTDCAPYGNPEYITIFDDSGNVYSQLAMPLPTPVQLPGTSTSPCIQAPSVCTQEADYTGQVVLPPSTGGYTLVYQRCCRNFGVVNLVSGGGATFTAEIPGNALATGNNSARFVSLPPLYVCLNTPLAISFSATDPDNDSLVYSLCDPYSGASATCPDPSPNGAGGGCSTAPNAPPYSACGYIAPFSASNFTNTPSNANNLVINPQTGILTGVPNSSGLFDITVCVSEYRNGNLLNTLRRDFQFTVAPCGLPIAYLPTATTKSGDNVYEVNCKSLNVNFTPVYYNPGSDSLLHFFWDFGVPGSTTDTITAISPSFTYPDTGTYQVHLIATLNQNGQVCVDTSSSLVMLYPFFETRFSAQSGCQDSTLIFIDSTISSFTPVTGWLWNFGDGTTSSLQNPTHIYSEPGNYVVQLIDTNQKCRDTAVNTIIVSQSPCLSAIKEDAGIEESVKIFPNPAKDQATIYYQLSNNQGATISIYNNLGQLCIQQKLTGNAGSQTLITGELQSGLYNYVVSLNNRVIKHDKFVTIK